MRLTAKAVGRISRRFKSGAVRGVFVRILGFIDLSGGLDGTRTRDPRRDRPVF